MSDRLTGRRGLLALVHCAKKDLHLDDDTYRAALEQVTGKSSASALSAPELGRVVDHFRANGWKPKTSGKPSADEHVRKLWAVWGELCQTGKVRHTDRAALKAFVKRMTGVDDPEWLSSAQVTKVIESLKKWADRVGTDARPPVDGDAADELATQEE